MSTVNQGNQAGQANPSMKKPTSQDQGQKGNPNMLTSTSNPGTENREWTRATEKAKDSANCATEAATHAANAVSSMANQAVSDVSSMASKAASDAATMASQAACNVGKQADELTANCGHQIEGFGETLGRNAPHSGYLGSASQAVANTVKESGHYIEEHKLSGIAADVAQVIKRNPIPAVCIALGLGWFVGRQLRG
jgi:hypothetical protein